MDKKKVIEEIVKRSQRKQFEKMLKKKVDVEDIERWGRGEIGFQGYYYIPDRRDRRKESENGNKGN